MTDAVHDDNIDWPRKTGELYHNHFDSTLWNDFPFRNDDVIISTYAKSGTTWVQQIVAQLIFNSSTELATGEISPWVDLRIPPKEEKIAMLEAQTHRRILKTHLPVHALVYSPKAKYLFVGRDGRDIVWSYYNHHRKLNDIWYNAINAVGGPGIEPCEPPQHEIYDYFHYWLENDGYPIWPFWDNISSWWDIRDLPNLQLVHFENLKQDLAGQIRRIAAFLDIPIDESKWSAILEHCSFDYMHAHAEQSVPLGGVLWEGGAKSFIHKGINGRWRDLLTAEDIRKYEAIAVAELGDECAHWLATGELTV